MPPSLSELKVTPSFCFPIKIRDDRTASIIESFISFSYNHVITAGIMIESAKSHALKKIDL